MSEKKSADLKSKVTYLPDVHRLLPQAPDAEQGVLSSFLLAPKEVGALCAERKVMPSWFHIPAHAEIYGVLIELWDKGEPLDFITIAQTLKDRNKLDAVGGAAFVSGLFTFLPTAANAKYYLEILHEKFVLREAIRVCTEYAARCYDEQDEVPRLMDGLEGEVLSILQDRTEAKKIKDLVMGAIAGIQALYERRGKITGMETGFRVLDTMLDGLHGAEMIVIAARPSMGKTALAMNIAEHVACNLGLPVAVFSLEMSAEQLVQRTLCSLARVNLSNVRNGFLSERDFPAITAAAAKMAGARLFIEDQSGISILELRAKARRMKAQHDIQAIFVDYLQLLRSSSKKAQDNRQIEIAEISSGLKGLSKELNIPVVVLAQLNRNPENRTGDSKGRPRLSDLRESGSIEQDADVVALLIRDEYYADSEEAKEELRGKATLIIAKQRNGPVGDVPLTFLKEFTRFEDRADGPAFEDGNLALDSSAKRSRPRHPDE